VTSTTAVYWDPFDVELDTDPHPTWKRMRDEAPVYRNDAYDFYALTRYHDVEAAHRELMRCYARLGEHAQALRHYQDLAALMQADLGSPPAPETTALFERLKRGEAV